MYVQLYMEERSTLFTPKKGTGQSQASKPVQMGVGGVLKLAYPYILPFP